MKYTDAEIVQAVRDAIAREACRNSVCQCAGRKLIVDHKATHQYCNVVAWAFYHRMPNTTPGALRKRLKRLAEAGHFSIKQWRQGDPIVLHLAESEALALAELGRQWWLSMGFRTDAALPFDPDTHQAAQDEASLLAGPTLR